MHFHFCADDTQLYISFSTNNDMEYTNSITKIEECLSDTDKWMSINRLKLNKDKTELLYLFSKYNPQQSLPPLRFQTEIIKPSPHARNIGAIFDTTMSMLPHVNNVNLPFIIFVPKNVSKSFNRCRMQLPEWLHGLGSVIKSLPSSSNFTGYLLLNE